MTRTLPAQIVESFLKIAVFRTVNSLSRNLSASAVAGGPGAGPRLAAAAAAGSESPARRAFAEYQLTFVVFYL